MRVRRWGVRLLRIISIREPRRRPGARTARRSHDSQDQGPNRPSRRRRPARLPCAYPNRRGCDPARPVSRSSRGAVERPRERFPQRPLHGVIRKRCAHRHRRTWRTDGRLWSSQSACRRSRHYTDISAGAGRVRTPGRERYCHASRARLGPADKAQVRGPRFRASTTVRTEKGPGHAPRALALPYSRSRGGLPGRPMVLAPNAP